MTWPSSATPSTNADRGGADTSTAGSELATVMAAASLAAGVIHFGFAPDHLAEDWAHGWFFLGIAWFQIAWAAVAYRRGGRNVLLLGAMVNAAIIAVWAVSRTTGLPFGPGAGSSEPAAFPDIAATVCEAVVVLGSMVLVALPSLRARPLAEPRLAARASGLFAGIALLSGTLALTPTLAAGHHHGAEGQPHERSAEVAGSAAPESAGDGHSHDPGSGATGTGGTPADIASASPQGTHASVGPWKGDSPCEESGFTETGGNNEGGATSGSDATEGHSHQGPSLQKAIDQATMGKLAAQQIEARSVATRYPTVADAEAGGYHKSTVYLPCIGAHYTNAGLIRGFDPAAPSELLFDGTNPDSKIVGLSYLIASDGHPEGFAGPNDLWHQHNQNGGLCLNQAGVVIGGEKMTAAACKKAGGHKVGLDNIWMLHDWVVPGWECTWGVFAGQCPELGGKAGGTAW